MEQTIQLTEPVAGYEASDGDKNIYLLLAMYRQQVLLADSIKIIRVYHSNKDFKKRIDQIATTGRLAMTAVSDFLRYYHQKGTPSEEQKQAAKQVEQTFLDCALLPYQTPLEKWPEMNRHITNFKEGTYRLVDDRIAEAIISTPDDLAASVSELINRFFPGTSDLNKKAFAQGLEHIIAIRQQLGTHV